jgi:uncharacterized damage-inducible protein DinB
MKQHGWLAWLAHKVTKVRKEILVSRGNKDLQVIKEFKEFKENKERKAIQVFKESQEYREIRDCRVTQELLVLRVILAHRETLVRTARMRCGTLLAHTAAAHLTLLAT